MHGAWHILTLMLMLTIGLTSCENDDDFIAPVTPDTNYDFSFTYNGQKGYVYTLQTHTQGTYGFPVVIMADGYDATDIENGLYDKDVDNAVAALKSQFPMTKLYEYLDIYEVVVESNESGIDYTQHDTAFKTYLEGKQSTGVIGDTAMVYGFTYSALRKDTTKLNNALTIVLLNSTDYAGVTLMSCDTTAKDSIPGGWSLSYVPAEPTISNGDNLLTELILHEAVGHGIGKLADEYYYDATPTSEDILDFKYFQKYGWSNNIKYFDNNETGEYDESYLYKTDKTNKYYVLRTIDAADDVLAPFAADSRYSSEEHKWIQGGNTFLEYTTDYCGQDMEYINPETGSKKMVSPYKCKSYFYRSSDVSMMGDVVNYVGLEFNILSRLAIYKRINRVCYGSSWKYDFATFAEFDKGSTTSSASTKRMYTKSATSRAGKVMKQGEKKLARPGIIKNISWL